MTQTTNIQPLVELIHDLGTEHMKALKEPVYTNYDKETGETVSTFMGKEYKNLSFDQVRSLQTCHAAAIYHQLQEALDYQQRLISSRIHANDYLRWMRQGIRYNYRIKQLSNEATEAIRNRKAA